MSDRKKILFVTSTRIGDAILSTGLLSHLIDRHADAGITVACGAPAAPLFSSVPNLDRLIVIRKKSLKRHWLELWASCLGTRWDVIVDLRSSGLAWFLPAAVRRVKRVRGSTMHRIEELAGVLGLDDPPPPKIWSAPQFEEEAAGLIPEGGPVLMLGPTANWAGKEWRLERFVSLVHKLTAHEGLLPGARVAVLGSREERSRALPFINAIPREQLIDLFGLGLPASYDTRRTSCKGLVHVCCSERR